MKETDVEAGPPRQPRPNMTLNILSRQTSDPGPKESADINPSRSLHPAPGPRLCSVQKPSHSLLSPGLLQAYLCFLFLLPICPPCSSQSHIKTYIRLPVSWAQNPAMAPIPD